MNFIYRRFLIFRAFFNVVLRVDRRRLGRIELRYFLFSSSQFLNNIKLIDSTTKMKEIILVSIHSYFSFS